jgi:putative hydrolase of the HAD superfamily
MPDLLVLDVDGVLLDPQRGGCGHWSCEIEERFGIAPELLACHFFEPHWADVVEGRRLLADALRDALVPLGSEVSTEALIDFWMHSDFVLFDEAVAVARRAVDAGVRVALATNQEHVRADYVRGRLEHSFPIHDVAYSARLQVSKPTESFFVRADAQFREAIEPTRILFVDDTAANVDGARRCGWPSLLADADRQWVHEVDAWLAGRLPIGS